MKLNTLKLIFLFSFLLIISNSVNAEWTRPLFTLNVSNITYSLNHNELNNLAWSVANHTIDSDILMNQNNITNAHVLEANLIGINATGEDGIFVLTTDDIIPTYNKGIFSTRNGFYDWIIGYIATFGLGRPTWIETYMFVDGNIGGITRISETRNNTYDFKTVYYNDFEVATNFSAKVVNSPTINTTTINADGYFNMFEPDFATFGGSHCGFQMSGNTGTIQCYNDTTEFEWADFNLYAGNIRMNLINSNVTMNNLTSTDGTFTRLKGTTTSGTTARFTTAHLITVNTSNVTIAKGNLVLTQGNVTIIGKANITGNLYNYGNTTINNYYGEVYYYNYSVGTEVPISTTYGIMPFANSTNGTMLNGFTFHSDTTLELIGDSGAYHVEYSMSGIGTQNHIYIGSIFVDGTEQQTAKSTAIGKAGSEVEMSGFGIIRLNLGSNVTLRLKDNSGTGTGTYKSGKIYINRIGN